MRMSGNRGFLYRYINLNELTCVRYLDTKPEDNQSIYDKLNLKRKAG